MARQRRCLETDGILGKRHHVSKCNLTQTGVLIDEMNKYSITEAYDQLDLDPCRIDAQVNTVITMRHFFAHSNVESKINDVHEVILNTAAPFFQHTNERDAYLNCSRARAQDRFNKAIKGKSPSHWLSASGMPERSYRYPALSSFVSFQ